MSKTRKSPRQTIFPDGTRICRNCPKPVARGRISYCSDACALDFEIKYFPSRTRWHVFKRDKGICAKCGCDTEKLQRIFRHCRRVAGAVARELGFNGWIHDGDLWQADHIVECVNGGWGKGLDNFRTLCTPCHKSETKRLVGKLAESRKSLRFEREGVLFPDEAVKGPA